MLKIALVGCGQIADAHIEQASNIAGVEVVALCDLNPLMVEQAALRYGIKYQFTDLDAMIKQIKPDVVHITTPPQSHYMLAKKLLSQGVSVQVEKPFTVHLYQAEELLNIALKTNAKICVTHSNAFDPAYLSLKKSVEQGRIGNIVHIDAWMGYNLKGPFGAVFMKDPNHWLHSLPGGVYQNNLSHPISMVLGLLTSDITTVRAHGYRLRKDYYYDVRDQLVDELRVHLQTKECSVNICFSCHARPVQLKLAVQGSVQEAQVSIDARAVYYNNGSTWPGPFAKVGFSRGLYKQARAIYKDNIKQLLKARLHYFSGMHQLFSTFYEHIADNHPAPMSIDDIYKNAQVMEAIVQQVPPLEIN